MPQTQQATTPRVNGVSILSDAQIRDAEEMDLWDKQSITKSFRRLRLEERPGYVRGLEENDKAKLRADARRVQRSRECLKKSGKEGKLFPEVTEAFKDWRLDAEKRGANFNHTLSERAQYFESLDLDGISDKIEEVSGFDRDAAHDFKTGVLFFEKCGVGWKKATYHGTGFDKHETFPNQKMTVHDALCGEGHNIFGETKDDQGRRHLKWIHLPANHMEWVEVCSILIPCSVIILKGLFIDKFVVQRAIARFYEEDEEPDESKRKMTNQTLAREFWRGQVHGAGLDKHPIHARHLRTRCLSISLGKKQRLIESLGKP